MPADPIKASLPLALEFLEAIDDVLYAVDHQWRVAYVNRRAEALWGGTRQAILGRPLWDFVPAERSAIDYQMHMKAAREKKTTSYETFSRIQGAWVEVSIHPTLTGLFVNIRDISERKQAQEALRLRESRLASELDALTRVHAVGTRLASATDLAAALHEVLEAAMATCHAPIGCLQVRNRMNGPLEIVAYFGFGEPFLEHFTAITAEDQPAVGQGVHAHQRVIIEDVNLAPDFEPFQAAAAQVGYRALQATPLLSSRNELLGIITTCFPHPHRLTGRELRRLDFCVRMTADLIARFHGEEEVRELNASLERRVEERTLNLRDSERVRTELLQRLVTAQEQERRRIARELHDEMGQSLAALIMGLRAMEDAPLAPEQARERLRQLQQLADQMGREVHDLALELRPTSLDDLGLNAALTQLVEAWGARNRIQADLHTAGIGQPRLPPDIETALYRIVQEALTNISKHASAARVSVILERKDHHVSAIVEDDGVGFDADSVLRSAHIRRRLGLPGMRERVLALKGTLEIESAQNHGTTVFVRLPLPSA